MMPQVYYLRMKALHFFAGVDYLRTNHFATADIKNQTLKVRHLYMFCYLQLITRNNKTYSENTFITLSKTETR